MTRGFEQKGTVMRKLLPSPVFCLAGLSFAGLWMIIAALALAGCGTEVAVPDDNAGDRGQEVPGETLTIDLDGGVSMVLVRIPAGTFDMGDLTGVCTDAERPVHTVTISQPFYLGKYEVTETQWQAVLGPDPMLFDRDNFPVEQLSWNDCQAFCQAVQTQTGYAVRLPTEAEWEYACRAGTTTDYYFGNDAAQLGEYAWYWDNSGIRLHEVGGRLPNALGLYDMYGNASEWVQDWYGDYPATAQTDPQGAPSGDYRVIRGGSCCSYDYGCYSAYRHGGTRPNHSRAHSGFRVAWTSPALP